MNLLNDLRLTKEQNLGAGFAARQCKIVLHKSTASRGPELARLEGFPSDHSQSLRQVRIDCKLLATKRLACGSTPESSIPSLNNCILSRNEGRRETRRRRRARFRLAG